MDRDELLRLLRAFEAERLEYVLVGATAMGFHGLIRATEDVDLFVRATPENRCAVVLDVAFAEWVVANLQHAPALQATVGHAHPFLDAEHGNHGFTHSRDLKRRRPLRLCRGIPPRSALAT